MLLLLGENPNLQNWSISKLSSFVTHQLRVLLHRSTRLQEGHIPTWDLLSYWDAHLWCASCNCKSWFWKRWWLWLCKVSHLKWPQCWRVIARSGTLQRMCNPWKGLPICHFFVHTSLHGTCSKWRQLWFAEGKEFSLVEQFPRKDHSFGAKKCCFTCFHCLNSTSCRQIQLLLHWHVLCEPKSMMIACGYNV